MVLILEQNSCIDKEIKIIPPGKFSWIVDLPPQYQVISSHLCSESLAFWRRLKKP